MKKITILCPAYNESKSLPRLAEEIGKLIASDFGKQYQWELLVVNDGSRDNSLEVMARQHELHSDYFNYLNLSRNFGKENAMLAGLDYATGDCVIIMDADLQHPISAIPDMVRCWEDGYDDVYGRRLTRGKESIIRKKLSLTYYRLLQKSTRVDILPNVGDFRLLDRRVVDAVRALRETQRNTKGLIAWVGYRKTGVDFETADRQEGASSFNLLGLLKLAMEGITGFTTAPLRFATIMGMAASLAAFVYMIVILCKTIFWGEPVQGFATIMTVMLFLGGCTLLSLGIIGEYIARIFNESKQRPPYIAESLNGHKIS